MIDIDGARIGAHSEKQDAPTYERGPGFYPVLAGLDAGGEALAGAAAPRAGLVEQHR